MYIYVCLLEEKWCQSCTCGLWKMMGLAVWPFQFLKAFVFISFPQFSFLFFPVEPEIQVDKVWVHADVSVEVEISCIVHAEPMAEVSNDTYDKCTLYQGYENRYNLIKCWHIFQEQPTVIRTATGSRKKSWKVNWQKIFQISTKSETFGYFTKATWSIRIIPVYKALQYTYQEYKTLGFLYLWGIRWTVFTHDPIIPAWLYFLSFKYQFLSSMWAYKWVGIMNLL